MPKETKKIPANALVFTDKECFAKTSAPEEGKPRSMSMTAYSGKVIKNHWYWGDLVIDTEGMSMAKKTIPILSDHNTDKKIGFGSFERAEDYSIQLKGIPTFVDTPFAQEFISLSDQGFPYEASIRANPISIQRLMEKEETEVNGFKLVGPATVWRKSVLKECSVVTFGADPNTKSVAMSEEEDVVVEDETLNTFKEEENMDLAKLKSEHPTLFSEVLALGHQEAENEFAPIKLGLEKQVADLTAEKSKLSEDVKMFSGRVVSLEKSETIRREKEMRSDADAIFASVVSEFKDIPERLHSKIRKLVNHETFIKDDQLDKEAFKAAVTNEVKDWVSEEGESDVIGFSHSRKEEESFTGADKLAEDLFKLSGANTKH